MKPLATKATTDINAPKRNDGTAPYASISTPPRIAPRPPPSPQYTPWRIPRRKWQLWVELNLTLREREILGCGKGEIREMYSRDT